MIKFLVDQNLTKRIWRQSQALPFYFYHVSDLGLKGFSDYEIVCYAIKHTMVILTHDDDFHNLVMTITNPPKIIYLIDGNFDQERHI